MSAQPQPATYDDLLKVSEHLVAELICGALYVQPRPHPRHALSATRLSRRLGDPFDDGLDGPGGWVILVEPELHLAQDVLVPDLAGWRRERLPQMPETVGIDVVPDWICEVLSPATARTDRIIKMPLYARCGVAYLWLIDPQLQTLEAYALSEGSWRLLGSAAGADSVRLAPFDAVVLQLEDLWRW